jgi:UDP-glucose 4-epimerase
LTVAQADIRNGPELLRIFSDIRPEIVFHLAALHFIPYCNAHPAECLEVNVVGTENLLEACRRFPPRQLVIASTAAVYPISDGICSEEGTPAGPTDVYGLGKWINEQQLELFARSADTRCAAARISNVYGPRETNPHIVPEIVDQLVNGATELMLGNTAPKRDYIYVDDVAEAFVSIAERNPTSFRVFNVATSTEYSVAELVEALSKHAGGPVSIRTDPQRVRSIDRMRLMSDNGRIRSETGWSPRFDLQQGLAALWQYTLENRRVLC